MSRFMMLSKLNFLGSTIILESIRDPWGESDSLLSDIESTGHYDENQSLSLWIYLATTLNDGEVMLDVGAYSGVYSLFAAKFIKLGAIGAIEASAVTYGRLVRNIMLNNLDMNIAAGHFAASNSKIATLSHMYGIYTTCAGDTIKSVREVDHSESVPGIQLDELISEASSRPGVFGSKSVAFYNANKVLAIKIDVEGAELEVFKGSRKILENNRPVIICESLTNDSTEELTYYLNSFSYQVNRISEERNYLCLPAEKSRNFMRSFENWLSTYQTKTLQLERYLQLLI